MKIIKKPKKPKAKKAPKTKREPKRYREEPMPKGSVEMTQGSRRGGGWEQDKTGKWTKIK